MDVLRGPQCLHLQGQAVQEKWTVIIICNCSMGK